MASNGNDRGGLLSAGGILSIIVGVFEVIGGALAATLTSLGAAYWQQFAPLLPRLGGEIGLPAIPAFLTIAGIVLAVLGIIAIVGGISAIRRKSFGLSLAGAICAFLPVNLLGILALIFVSLAKGEFEVE